MILNFHKKKQIINTIYKITKKSLSAVSASLEGIMVNEITALRKEARMSDVSVHVVKNTLMRRIIKKTPFEPLTNTLIGQTIIGFSMKHPRDSARIFVKFSKEHENFKIKGAVFEGKFITESNINVLSNLPNYKEAILKLVSVIKTNSIKNLIYTLQLITNQKTTG